MADAMFRRHSHSEPPVRYYIYISDSKLDMLFEQIDQKAKKRISAKLKIDLKIASITLTGADAPMPTRTAKLRLVEEFIRTKGNAGTVERPGTKYFYGRMEMSWEWAGPNNSGVWFQGNSYLDGDFQCVGLGGSRGHVLGEEQPTGTLPSTSWPAIREILKKKGFPHNAAIVRSELEGDLPNNWLNYVYREHNAHFSLLAEEMIHQLEFLAIPLAETSINVEGYPVHVVIGTPLYVAMT
jgi:hypothetical protein